MPGEKIMIVDDDEQFLEELKETLTLCGYDTVTFSDGISALKEVDKIKPDVMLLDLKMDGKNGFQVADELKRLPGDMRIPIIAMTGVYREKAHILLMNICGIQACLIKPFNLLDVIAKIETALQGRERLVTEKEQNKDISKSC